MRILLLAHSFNSLTQRLWVELAESGHDVSCEFDVNDATTEQAVRLAAPDVIIAPFLKRAIPESIWARHTCLVVHPGPVGDRGPSALDWAILDEPPQWGVTVLQAEGELDGGPVWASRSFAMRDATKSSLYRNEVADAATAAVIEALGRLDAGPGERPATTVWRPVIRQADRAPDWGQDDTATILRKIRSADGAPGLLARLDGVEVYLHDAHRAAGLVGPPGIPIARSGSAVAVATTDGAVWIGQLRRRAADGLKLPALGVLPHLAALPEREGPAEIYYQEQGDVGWLHFPFLNGAMDTDRCRRLALAFKDATTRPTRVIVLAGGPDFWSNGLHLGVIEAADSPADESWRNIEAMNDLCRAILDCDSHLVIAAMQGNAGAGGVFLALAADRVLARDGIVLNPHYKAMGNLHGSEYWTYLLPRRCGEERARAVTQARLPMGVREAARLGLIDGYCGPGHDAFLAAVTVQARAMADTDGFAARLAEKRARRAADEAIKPLGAYRAEEMAHMAQNFYGFDPSYHFARHNFIHKIPKGRTPRHLARHRK